MLHNFGRLYPFYSGNFSLVNCSAARKVTRQGGEFWCKSPGGPMLVPVSDSVGRCIYYSGDYDKKITWLCRRILSRGDTALDVGANLGVVALAMAKFVGRNGMVHAFEPNQAMHRFIEASVKRCHHTNLQLHKMALGTVSATLDLFVPIGNFGAASLVNRYEGSTIHRYDGSIVQCPVEPLSEIVKREHIGRVRLMKLDVEGFENQVLLGMGPLRPDAIIVEVNEISDLPFRERPTIKTLIDLNYRLFAIPRALLKMSVSKFDLEDQEPPSHDILALANDKADEILTLLQ